MGSTVTTLSGDARVTDVTLTLDTNVYASGDVLVVPQEMSGVCLPGEARVLRSITLLDEDDAAQGLDLIFLNATATLGTINAAVSISDADARKIVGIVEIASGDYVDLVNSQVAMKTGLDLVLQPAAGSTSLWIAAVSRGTGTYTASGIKLKLGFA